MPGFSVLETYHKYIGHLYCDDNLGRYESGTGEINDGWISHRLDGLFHSGEELLSYLPFKHMKKLSEQ
ncbi:hypothetical protein [uncultured Sphaerochaeta sp.]|uniref:hypothetical protein n=1 Tax=uncultured Sphaerochaeta sp. TaxID=886478 RepID=UPI002A0A33B2|nr:hypothetical protein [uncultured Sphaerochaeta sp.]